MLALLLLSLIAAHDVGGNKAEAEKGITGHSEKVLTGYIKSIHADGLNTLVFDEIQWYQGAEADRVFAEREPKAAAEIGGTPDGYYIVNDREDRDVYPYREDAQVLMQIYGNRDIHWNEELNLNTFIQLFGASEGIDLKAFPYHITLVDGVVTKIVQQYIP